MVAGDRVQPTAKPPALRREVRDRQGRASGDMIRLAVVHRHDSPVGGREDRPTKSKKPMRWLDGEHGAPVPDSRGAPSRINRDEINRKGLSEKMRPMAG